ncbi:potassium/proton antiporter [Halobacteriovorax sp. JY17]|uniref:potassium/proton antiporter n=1 Tax=Halobacteriovorax sp. JY17 TaxID=2014617 RepID=UPI000C6BCA5D|nr:potassium/proton antiporter [Halobacteriovorax sp. JY17]PIK15221.1 MAG: K+/H+ antiporter [Halobacteriovorax sp. JY17]
MEYILNNALIIGSVLLLLSVVMSKSLSKFGLPILILFLFIGMISGSEGIGGIDYENYELTHSLSLVAICLIIFTGGLLTKISDIKPVMKSGVVLSTLGILLTTGMVGVFCHYLFHIDFFEALLIGAILSSTDAAAVFTVLRDKNAQVSKNVKSLLELESGSNDPMAYLLVTIFLGLYQADATTTTQASSFLLFLVNPLFGILGGYAFFKIFKLINDKVELDFQGLYPALALGFLFLTYSLVTSFYGNGFLAVYIFGLRIGNERIIHKHILTSFFDGISWLFQIGLFIMLGLLVFPSRLYEIAPSGSMLALFCIIIARPTIVFICLMFSKFDFKEKLLISWAGLKGATPIVFASLVATNVGKESLFIFDLVFFTVLISALVQGSTVKLLAKKLNLLIESIFDPDFPIDLEVIEKTKNGIREIKIEDSDFAVEKRVVDLGLPKGTVILFIKRNGGFIIPDGSTSFKSQDKILIVTSEKEDLENSLTHFRVDKTEDEPEIISMA